MKHNNGSRRETKPEIPLFNIWKKKRKWTVLIFIAFGFLVGVEYSAVVLSMWYFLKDTIETDHAPIYYSVGMASTALTASVSSIVIGKWIDRSRNIKFSMILISLIVAVGNVIYTLNFSVWFLIIGRLISGIADALTGAISGKSLFIYTRTGKYIVFKVFLAISILRFRIFDFASNSITLMNKNNC